MADSASRRRRCERCRRSYRTLGRASRTWRSGLRVDLRTALHELDGLGVHALAQRVLVGEALLRRVVAHVLRDLHRAEVRPAHRAEVRELRAVLRQRLVVELARLVRIEAEVELILPAELEARLGQRVVAQLRAGMP